MIIKEIINNMNISKIYNSCIIFLAIFVLYRFYIYQKESNLDINKNLESFTNYKNNQLLNQISSTSNYYYLNDNKYSGILAKDYHKLPILRCSSNFDLNNEEIITYHDKILKYFKKNIFPINPVIINNDESIITELLNNNLDIAILNEEFLRNFINTNSTEELNFSMIGGLYYLDMYLIGQPDSNLNRLSELETTITIYTLPKYRVYLRKLIQSYQFNSNNPVNIINISNIDELISQYMNDDIEYIFILSHPLDKYILEMSDNKRIKLIHLQDREEDAPSRRETIELNSEMTAEEFYRYVRSNRLNNQEVITRNNIVPSDDIDRDTHKNILKRYIPRIYSKVIDLNYFHSTSNEYTYLETYSIKQILVANNSIKPKHIKILTSNLIKHMETMRNKIIKDNYIVGYQNHNNYDLKPNEILVVDINIPLHEETKSIYEKIGLIKYTESEKCKIII